MAGRHNAKRSIRSLEPGLAHRSPKRACQSAQCFHLGVPFPQATLSSRKIGSDDFERIANRRDAASPCRTQNPAEGGREHVRMLVSIDVRHVKPM